MNNLITGTPNNDILSGGNTDTLAGGAGDDTYRLSGQDAIILEAPGEGRDLVVADFVRDYVLPDNVEDLIVSPYYTGAILPIHGTGNDLGNVITAQAQLQSYLLAVGPHGQTSGPPYQFFDSHVIAGGRGNDTLTADKGDDTQTGLNKILASSWA